MKKLINLKGIMIILISVMMIMFSTTILASDPVLDDVNTNQNNATTISPEEYEEAQNNTNTNTTNNNTNSTNNTDNEKLPQTGIEDTGLGILLIIAIGSSIFAYKKVSDYRNI